MFTVLMRALFAWLNVAFLFVTLGCGARTPIDDGPSPGRDAGSPDASPDAGALVADCGEAVRFTPLRVPVRISGQADGPDRITGRTWELVERPAASEAVLASTEGADTSLTSDVVGEYRVRFTAEDAAGRTGSCEVRVFAAQEAPVAACPEGTVRVPVNEVVSIMGAGFDAEGPVTFRWEIRSAPPGANPFLGAPAAPVTDFSSDVPGAYELELFVTDADGAVASCVLEVRVTAPPEAFCPMGPIRAPTRQPVSLRGRAEDDTGIARVRWEVLERPSMSTAEPMPRDRQVTQFTPDRQGEYQLRFTVFDDDGLSASCEVTVIGLPTPPDALCPADIDTRPLSPVELRGRGVDDGTIVEYRWRLVSAPAGSAAGPPRPATGERTTFVPDFAGEYRIELTVVDDDGQEASCTFLVRALAVEGLRVEMFWDTDNTDMDTHLLHPDGTGWFNSDDCYYANCQGGGLPWGAPGPDDDPSLDIDDVDGFGPENINIELPERVTYRVGVHAYRGDGSVTVRVYCGGSTTVPRETFGPVRLTRTRDDFWRVADVRITAAGCAITDLATGGRPNIAPRSDAETRR